MFKHILVSLDGSDCSKKTLSVSIGLAQAMETQISLVSVAEPLSKMPTTMSEVEEEKRSSGRIFPQDPAGGQRESKIQRIDLEERNYSQGTRGEGHT